LTESEAHSFTVSDDIKVHTVFYRREFIKSALAAGVVSSAQSNEQASGASTDECRTRKKQPRFMFYHDGRHPLIYMYEPPMQKEEFEAGVDELAGTPVDAIMFCLGDGRTVLHDTKVGELWGHNVKKWSHAIFRRAHQNAEALIAEGHDPLQVICNRAHEKNLLLYPTLLVQQGRRKRGEDVRCSEFRFNNTHLEIGAAGDLPDDFPGLTFLDFKHQEVRDERFALIAETLERYPVDGFELQLDYGLHYFHPNEVHAGLEIMTAWVAEVYHAVKSSGSERELAIRVPGSIEGCLSIGLDIQEWIRRGIVDVLIPQTLSGPELLNHNADFRPFVEAAGNSHCRIHAALQSHVDSDRLAEASVEMIRGAACNYWEQGIDGLYLAHWFGNWPYDATFYEKLRELPHPEVMASKDKFYYVPTTTGRYREPKLEPGLSMQLPVDLDLGVSARVNLAVSDDLPRWDKAGRVHEVMLRLRIMNTTELDRLTVRFNGKVLPESLLRKLNEMYRMSAPRYRTGSGYWFIYRLDHGRWPKRGNNVIEVTLTRRDAELSSQISIRDVELETKYLMGRNFHRGQDADLGPAEPSGV